MSKKVVAITGVCGGLGRELANGFIKNGFHIFGIDINKQGLEDLEEELLDDFSPFYCDLSEPDHLSQLNEQIFEEYGAPDIWINNAGIADVIPFVESDLKKFELVMELNLMTAVRCSHFWINKMNQRGSGRIVNIASVAGHVPPPYLSSYAASKHALVGFTESLQQELSFANSHVEVTLVSPGFVDTNIIKRGEARGFPKAMEFMLSKPKSCCTEIVSGILKGESFIKPTLNGKLMLSANRWSPKVLRQSTRLMAAKSWRQLLGLEKIEF